jgi:hypothetical protein
VLATVGGILIVGVGGGLIGPMRHRWERILDRAEQEAPRAAAEAQANSGRAARDLTAKVQSGVPTSDAPTTPQPTVTDGRGAYRS